MDLKDILNLIAIMVIYAFAGAAVSLIPGSVFLFFYRRRMTKYYETTGLNPYVVPTRLRNLLPVVKKWGNENGDEGKATYQKASKEDRLQLSRAVGEKIELINQWLMLFRDQPLSPEARAFYLTLKLLQESDTIIDHPSSSKELIDSNFNMNQSYQSTYWGKAKIIKVSRLTRGVVGFLLFIGYFIVFGNLWAFLFPTDFDATGLIAVNLLSGVAVISTGSLIIGFIKIFGYGKIELRF